MSPAAGASRARLLLVGAGHAHAGLLLRYPQVTRIYDVRWVAPHDPYRGGTPLHAALAGLVPGHTGRIRLATSGVVRISRRALALQSLHRRLWLDDGRVLDYDVASVNTGARRLPAWAEQTQAVDTPRIWSGHSARQIYALADCLDEDARSRRLVVAGGSRCALEFTAALAARAPERALAGLCLLWPEQPGTVPAAIERAQRRLAAQGVTIVRNATPSGTIPGGVITDDGRRFVADHLLWAMPGEPDRLAQSSDATLTETGFRVDRHLRIADGAGGARVFALGASGALFDRQALPGWDAPAQVAQLARALGLGRETPTSARSYRHPNALAAIYHDEPMGLRFWQNGRARRQRQNIEKALAALLDQSGRTHR